MAEISKFFNAVLVDGKYDREYLASDFADYFGSVLSAGLLLDANEEYGLQVKVDNALQTSVDIGKALIKGYHYENTTPKTLEHSIPERDHDRIDRVVLRMDIRNQARYIKAVVKEGLPSNDPKPPGLQRDEFVYELSLAQIRLRANTSSIDVNDIIDERAYEDLCGIVQSLVTVPISVFQQQFDVWFEQQKLVYGDEMEDWKDEQQQDFMDWFQSIQNILDGDIAGNLLNLINNHINDTNVHIQEGEREKWDNKASGNIREDSSKSLRTEVVSSLPQNAQDGQMILLTKDDGEVEAGYHGYFDGEWV